jgi:cell division protein FtsN
MTVMTVMTMTVVIVVIVVIMSIMVVVAAYAISESSNNEQCQHSGSVNEPMAVTGEEPERRKDCAVAEPSQDSAADEEPLELRVVELQVHEPASDHNELERRHQQQNGRVEALRDVAVLFDVVQRNLTRCQRRKGNRNTNELHVTGVAVFGLTEGGAGVFLF